MSDSRARRYAPRDVSGTAVPKGISRQEGSCMSASRLRVYYGPEQVATEDSTTATIPPQGLDHCFFRIKVAEPDTSN